MGDPQILNHDNAILQKKASSRKINHATL